MTRLVNDMRATIINRIIEHTFSKRIAFVQSEHAACAVAIYEDVFSKKHRDLMDSLPNGWLPTDDDIYVTVGERSHRYSFNGDFSGYSHGKNHNELHRRLEQVFYTFPQAKHRQCLKVYDAEDDGIGERCAVLLEMADGLQRNIADARAKLSATLDSFHTTEKLITAWPEIEPFIPAPPAPPPPVTLPTVPTADLNTLFNLPVSANV